MSLTTRVSCFFLGALALVLAVFTIGVYEFAGRFFHQSAEERLLTTFHALVAAAEIEPDGIEWNPAEHQLAGERFSGGETIHWIVTTGDDQVIDSSPEAMQKLRFALNGQAQADGTIEDVSAPGGQPWWVVRQRLTVPQTLATAAPSNGSPSHADDMPEYPEMVIMAGMSVASVQAMSNRLAAWIVPLAVGIWCVAAVGGGWFCRRALAPVSRMAEATRSMSPARLEARLPVAKSRDELEELGKAFNSLLDRLHDAFERQKRFTGEASHQLRTPLAVLQGQIEVALRRERSPDEHRRVLAELQQQAGRLAEIVESLLFLARADSEARLERLQPLDLGRWLADHLATSSGVARASDLSFERSGSSCPISGHPPLLAQLVDNLLENAFKYSAAGERVSVRLEVHEETIRLIVEDRGCGIPPEDLPHVFEAFFRATRARRLRPEGLGLGLSVARRIASALGATMTIHSDLGKGTRVEVVFPRLRSSEPAEPCIPDLIPTEP